MIHTADNRGVCVCACVHVCVQLFSYVRLFAALWIVTHQTPLSMEFSRQEQWSGLPFPTPGDLPDLSTPMHLIFCKPSPQTISFPTYKMGTCQTSLVVQWLRLCTSTQRTQVQFLVGELRFHMPCDTAKTFFKKWAHFYRFFFLFLNHPASILSLKYLNIQFHK